MELVKSNPFSMPTDFQLRWYQEKAVEWVVKHAVPGEAILLIAPTGSGKTEIAIHFIRLLLDKGWRCVFTVHTEVLYRQTLQRFRAVFGEAVGYINAQVTRPRDITIAMHQTLCNRLFDFRDTILVIDEAHRSYAKTYQEMMSKVRGSGGCVIGMTATPYRRNKFERFCEIYSTYHIAAHPYQLIEDNYLAPVEVYSPCIVIQDENLKLKGKGPDSDFSDDSYAIEFERLNGARNMFDAYKNYADGEQFVVFSQTVKLAEAVADYFTDRGVKVEAIHYDMTRSQQVEVVERFKNKEIVGISNVNVLTEGFDVPACGCVILNFRTKSKSRCMQAIGRAQRPHPGKVAGIVIDMALNVRSHGNPNDVINPDWAILPDPAPDEIKDRPEDDSTAPKKPLKLDEGEETDFTQLDLTVALEDDGVLEEGEFYPWAKLKLMWKLIGARERAVYQMFGPFVVTLGYPVPAYAENFYNRNPYLPKWEKLDYRRKGMARFVEILVEEFDESEDDVRAAVEEFFRRKKCFWEFKSKEGINDE